MYAEHWAGHRRVEVTIEEDQIVIRRAGGDEPTPPTDSPELSPTALPKPFQSTPTAVRTICSRGTCGCSLHHIASPVSPERTISAAISIVS